MNKRFAILMCGHLRNYSKAASSILQNLIIPLTKIGRTDIFIDTWQETETIDSPGGLEGKLKAEIKKTDVADLYEIYDPISVNVHNHDLTKHLFHWSNFVKEKPSAFPNYVINDVLIGAAQQYNVYQAYQAANNYANLNNFQYDLIFRIRPDFCFIDKFNIEFIENTLIVPILWKEPYKDTNKEWIYAIDDRFAYGNHETMHTYCQTYRDIKNLIDSWNYDSFPYTHNESGSQQLSNERILHRQMILNRVNLKENGIKLERAW